MIVIKKKTLYTVGGIFLVLAISFVALVNHSNKLKALFTEFCEERNMVYHWNYIDEEGLTWNGNYCYWLGENRQRYPLMMVDGEVRAR